MLLSMFVLIAAALPAESLAVSAIGDSQASVWNVVRQPPGLLLFLLLGLSLTLRSEEHTSELQSLMRLSSAVFCWKQKTNQSRQPITQCFCFHVHSSVV